MLMFLSRFVKQLRGPGTPLPARKDAIAVLRELLETGKITPVIDRTRGVPAHDRRRNAREGHPHGGSDHHVSAFVEALFVLRTRDGVSTMQARNLRAAGHALRETALGVVGIVYGIAQAEWSG
jgi:hypothetical protein